MSLPVRSHVPSRRGLVLGAVSGARGGGELGMAPVKIETHTCENITFPQLHLRAVKIRWVMREVQMYHIFLVGHLLK